MKIIKIIGLVLLLIVHSFILFSCSVMDNTVEVEKEVIVEVEKIEYQDRNITLPCNTTTTLVSNCTTYNYSSTNISKSRELDLIQRIEFLESQQSTYWNSSECCWELNQSEIRWRKAEGELCDEWNSSWC